MPTFSASLDVARGRDRVAARAADAIDSLVVRGSKSGAKTGCQGLDEDEVGQISAVAQ